MFSDGWLGIGLTVKVTSPERLVAKQVPLIAFTAYVPVSLTVTVVPVKSLTNVYGPVFSYNLYEVASLPVTVIVASPEPQTDSGFIDIAVTLG